MNIPVPSRVPTLLLSFSFCSLLTHSARSALLYSETFDSVTLGANIEEGITTGTGAPLPQKAVWTGEAPAGWTVDDSLMQGLGNSATDGVVEWAGWSFTDQRWWAHTAGDQGRVGFTKGGGAVAMTDPDEWDDLTRSGPYNSFLVSPAIPLAAAGGSAVTLRFDSSWQAEAPQKAVVLVSWDGGEFTEIMRWEGDDTNGLLHPNAVNETVSLPLDPPTGAQNVRFRFGTIDAGNNWWWGIDNVALYTGEEPPRFETHPVSPEGVTLTGSSFTAAIGTPVDLFVTVSTETEAPTLQWVRMNGATRTVLTGETSEMLSLPSPTAADSGSYLVEATNSHGTIKSAPMKLTVASFTISQEPVATTVVVEGQASLSVMAEGTVALAYQWFKGPADSRVEIPGAVSPALDFASVKVEDAGLYSVRITSSEGGLSDFSDVVRLDVLPLAIEMQPTSIDALAGDAALFEITATGRNLTYQWYSRPFGSAAEPVLIPGATSSTYSVASVTRFGGGYYYVKVTSDYGTVSSTEAKLTVAVEPGPVEIFAENWQSVALLPNVEEGIVTGAGPLPNPQEAVWSPAAPNGWVIDNSGMPVPNPADVAGSDGVKEWYGWNFAEPVWWATTAEGQGRGGFMKGVGDSQETGIPGVIAVADADEWDDQTHTAGTFNSFLISPAVSLTGTTPGSVVLVFDSSWQREAPMKARVDVSLDGGDFRTVMLWTYDGPDQHNDNTDETVTIPIDTTAANTSLKFRFVLFDAGNNWWWAVDNIRVTAVTGTTPSAPPVITSVRYDTATHVATVKWASVPNRPYILQYSSDLQTWLSAATGLTGAAGAETTATTDVDTLFPTGVPTKLYFRISE